MKRRDFLRSAGVVSASLAFPGARILFAEAASFSGWRTFDLTTRVEVLKPAGTTRIWLPAGLISETPFQKTLVNTYHAEGGVGRMIASKADALGIVAAEFPAGRKPVLTLTSARQRGRCQPRGVAVLPPSHASPADRRNREGHGGRDY